MAHLREQYEAGLSAVYENVKNGDFDTAKINAGGLNCLGSILASMFPMDRAAEETEEETVDPAALLAKEKFHGPATE